MGRLPAPATAHRARADVVHSRRRVAHLVHRPAAGRPSADRGGRLVGVADGRAECRSAVVGAGQGRAGRLRRAGGRARTWSPRGLAVLDRNWRCALGEIDIVARDGDVLVVCEVKTRRRDGVRHPARGGDAGARRPGCAGWPRRWLAEPRRAPGRRCASTSSARAAAGPRARAGRARPGGGLMTLAADPGGGARRRRRATWSRSRPTSARGCRRSPSSGCPTRRCTESRDRVRAAMVNSGQHWPPTRRITVNLSPASLPKRGHRLRPRDRGGGARRRRASCRRRAVARRGAARRARPRRAGAAGARRAARRARRGRRRGRAASWCRRPTPPRRRSCPGVRVHRRCARWPSWSRWPTAASRRRASWPDAAPPVGPRRRTPRGAGPDLADVLGQATRRRAARGRRRRRPPPAADRAAGRRQDDAGRAAARPAAAARPRRRRSR